MKKIIKTTIVIILLFGITGEKFAEGKIGSISPPPPPVVAITSVTPASGTESSPASPRVEFSLTTTGTCYIEYFANTTNYGTSYNIGTGTGYARIFSDLTQGTYDLIVKATDNYSQVSADTFHNYVVNAQPPPVLTITSVTPASGTASAPASPRVEFSLTATGTCYIEYFANTTGYGISYNIGTGTGYARIFSDLTQGTYDLIVRATDTYSQVSSDTFHNYVVNSVPPPKPVITQANPASGTQIAPATTTITYTLDKNATNVKIYDGASIQIDYGAGQASGTHTFEFTGLNTGTHDLIVEATDNNGSDRDTLVYVVNAPPPPDVTITQADPASGTQTAPATTTITYTLDINATRVKIYDGAAIQIDYGGGQTAGTHTYQFTGLNTGTHNLIVEATNTYGSDRDTLAYVVNDPPPPDVTITQANPASGTQQAPANTTITYTLDVDATRVKIFLDSQIQIDYGGGQTAGTHTYDFTNLTQGTKNLIVEASNAYGTDVDTLAYIVNDPVPTTIEIISVTPSSGTVDAMADITIYYDLATTIVGGITLEVYVNGNIAQNLTNKETGSYHLPYTLDAGTHEFVVRGYLGGGEWVADTLKDYVVNVPPPPTIKITDANPESETQVAPAVAIVYYDLEENVSDAGVRVDYYYNGIFHSTDQGVESGENTKAYYQLDQDNNELVVKVTDRYGQVSTDTLVYKNIPSPPKVSFVGISPYSGSGVDPLDAMIQFKASQDGKIYISLNDSVVDSVDCIADTIYQHTYTSLLSGTHSFKVDFKNDNGNDFKEAFYEVKASPPVVTITDISPESSSAFEPADVTITLKSSKDGLFEFYLDKTKLDTSIQCTADTLHTFTFTGLSGGIHEFFAMGYSNDNGIGFDSLSYDVKKLVEIINTDPISGEAEADSGVTVTYKVEQGGTVSIFDGDSLHTSRTDTAGTHNYTYNAMRKGKHQLRIMLSNGNGSFGDSLSYIVAPDAWRVVEYNYDHMGNVTQIDADSIFKFQYEYDLHSRLKTVKTKSPNMPNYVTEATYHYNLAGQDSIIQLNKIGHNITFDYHNKRGWLTSIDYNNGKFNEYLAYLKNGNIDTMKISNYADGSWQDFTYNYTYDHMNRLTAANTALANGIETYSYDSDGMLLTKERNNSEINYTAVPNSHKLDSITYNGSPKSFTYDEKGNVIFDGLAEYSFNNFNRFNLPAKMEKDANNYYEFKYNDKGERIRKYTKATDETEYYLNDYTGKTLIIYDYATGKPKMANIFGNGLLGRIEVQQDTVDKRFYLVKDHLGSTRSSVKEDGLIVSATDYYPYGEEIRGYNSGSTLEKYKFTEKERDTETGYDYFGARYYSSKLALWQSVDPLANKYPSWSPYNYVTANPIRLVDQDGREGDDYTEAMYASRDRLSQAGQNAFDETLLTVSAIGSAVLGGFTAYANLPRILGVLAVNAPTINQKAISLMEAFSDAPEGMTAQSSLKGGKALLEKVGETSNNTVKSLQKHISKLEKYIADPIGSDNKGILKKAIETGKTEQANSIIKGRLNHLTNDINTFIKDSKEELKLDE